MGDSSDLCRCLALARRWLWLVLTGALLAGAFGLAITLRRPPVYRASATLKFQPSLSWMNGYYGEQVAKSLALMGPLAMGAAEIDLEASDGLDGPSGGVSIHWVSDTQLIEVSAVDLDPVRAAARANAGAGLLDHF